MNRIQHYILACAVAASLTVAACEKQNPEVNTATSGRAVVLVEDAYAPLIRELADTFIARTNATNIEIQPMSARNAVIELIQRRHSDTAAQTDTTPSLAMIIGRSLLEDEREAIEEQRLSSALIEIPIAYDGLVAITQRNSPLTATTVEQLSQALTTTNRTTASLEQEAGSDPVRFILPDANSSVSLFLKTTLLGGNSLASPVRSYSTVDSVVEAAASGEGVALVGWYSAQHDSNRIRPLKLGFTDSLGQVHSPTRIHTATLVMNTYPLKLSLNGYTFNRVNSLGNGFLTWLARSQDAQEALAKKGLEPKNMRFRFVTE